MNLTSIRDFAARNKSTLIDTGIIVGTTIAGVSLSIVLSNALSKSDEENLSEDDTDIESEPLDIPDTND